jgi:DNA polymerase-3 subunit epsilon
MREIVMDTETTGLDPAEGHRIVEIGAVELNGHVPTGRTFHQYINPRRDMPQEAFAVHGISAEFLADKPPFEAIAQAFLAFVGDARLVIHNAPFDMAFLNAELGWAGLPRLGDEVAIDTLVMARRKFPGAQASLDALCRRFEIDNSRRTYHGALLDSEILAEVYLELIGGRQPGFVLATSPELPGQSGLPADTGAWRPRPRPRPLPGRLSEAERAAHAQMVEGLGPEAVWRRYES